MRCLTHLNTTTNACGNPCIGASGSTGHPVSDPEPGHAYSIPNAVTGGAHCAGQPSPDADLTAA